MGRTCGRTWVTPSVNSFGTDDGDPESDESSTDTGRDFNPTDTGNEASTDCSGRPSSAGRRALQAELCSTDTPKPATDTDAGNEASTDPTPKPEPKRQRTDCSGRPSPAGRALPSASAAAGRALQAETPVPTTVGEMLKAMRALEGPDPLEDLLE